MIQVADSPDPRHLAIQAKNFKAQGGEAFIVYINPLGLLSDKTAKKDAIQAILAAGLKVGFVCEGWGGSSNYAHHDINAVCGTRDGATCGHYMDILGAPDGVAVYGAVDNDANQSQIEGLCKPYFGAFRKALLPKYKLGTYGCGALLTSLVAAKMIDYKWLSNAMGWNGSRAYHDAKLYDILQGLPTRYQGIDIDPDVLNPNSKDFGFWSPISPDMDINSDVAGA